MTTKVQKAAAWDLAAWILEGRMASRDTREPDMIAQCDHIRSVIIPSLKRQAERIRSRHTWEDKRAAAQSEKEGPR